MQELTLKIKLSHNKKQKSLLLKTMKEVNLVCDDISAYCFQNKTKNKFQIQTKIYANLRNNYKIGAQLTIRAIAKTCASIIDYKTQRRFRHYGSIDYDKKCCTISPNKEEISLATIKDRVRLKYVKTAYIQEILDKSEWAQGKLYYDEAKDSFYYLLSYKKDCSKPQNSTKKLGMDRGIKNVASLSNGYKFEAKDIQKLVKKFQKQKGDLQKKKTASSRRKLKRIGKRHARFIKDENHKISLEIISQAKTLNASLVLEDLKSLKQKRKKKPVTAPDYDYTQSKTFRRSLQNWSYYQLQELIEYKANIEGIEVEYINPRYTSQECFKCSNVDSSNRNADKFKCTSCGYEEHSDTNGAMNIAKRSFIAISDEDLLEDKNKISEILVSDYTANYVDWPNVVATQQCNV